MAFPTQFALSYELSKLVPVVPVLNLASRGLLSLVREFQRSGSDPVTENELARVIGRSNIDKQFASTFRNAVRASKIVKLAGIAELVLEVGAGPTVAHAIKEAPFFSMIVQLSVLLWAHHLPSLAKGLHIALLDRSGVYDQQKDDGIEGTLRCIRQQTSGFLWELYFSAVDEILKTSLRLPMADMSRAIPLAILRTLLETLPAVQFAPDKHFLAIVTTDGVSAIIIWAHHLLGLTVEVQSKHGVYVFGKDSANLTLNCSLPDSVPEIILFNATSDLKFRAAVDPSDVSILQPVCRHTLEGYGLRYLEPYTNDLSLAQNLVLHFMKGCLSVKELYAPTRTRSGGKIEADAVRLAQVPSDNSVLTACRILFPLYDISLAGIESIQDNDVDTKLSDQICTELRHLVFTLSMVNNLDECRRVPLNVHGIQRFRITPTEILTPREAFETLAILLLDEAPEQHHLDRAVVISAWGWSLCISSILYQTTGDLRADLAIKEGVPAHYGKRKEWVMDHESGTNWFNLLDEVDLRDEIVATPGDDMTIRSFMSHSVVEYLVGSTEVEFRVYVVFDCFNKPGVTARIRVGLRYMQDLFWDTVSIPQCSHPVQPIEELVVPGDSCVFRGFLYSGFDRSLRLDVLHMDNTKDARRVPKTLKEIFKHNPTRTNSQTITVANQTRRTSAEPHVYISMTAKNTAAQWMLLANLYLKTDHPRMFDACYTRSTNCCLNCALEYINAFNSKTQCSSTTRDVMGPVTVSTAKTDWRSILVT
ncbi:hypothetical protein MMC19_005341 [Ptychographa xylographoides]|nr:hypothetical protein [Ptychographa xylographoides]